MKKKRYFGAALFILLFLAFVLFLLWMLYVDTRLPEKKTAQISVIVYGENTDRWRSLDQGIAHACRELGLEKPTILTARSDDSKQVGLIQRELENGAQGLLVAAANAAAVEEALAAGSVPVVIVESGAGNLPCIRVDDTQLGIDLADHIAPYAGNIAVLQDGLYRQNVRQRYEGFTARMQELGKEPIVLIRDNPAVDLKSFLASELASHRPKIDTLVVLENFALESAIDAIPASMTSVNLCGVGCSDKVLGALDRGVAREVVFPNEYAQGYLAMLALAAKMELGKEVEPVMVQYSIVTRENMFQPEYERLLFPILQ